jgi:hypothetical protein
LTFTVNGRVPAGDFSSPLEDLVSTYVQNKWTLTIPPKSSSPPTDFKTNVKFSDYDYDGNSTYHVKIKEDVTTFNDELIGQGFLSFITPINFEISARRLTYGKVFEQLDNIRLEIVRIIGNYRPDEISGIPGMDIVAPGDVQPLSQFTEKGPRSIWRAKVVANIQYSKCWF